MARGVWVASEVPGGVERAVRRIVGRTGRVYGWWQWARAREALAVAGPRWTAWWESACIGEERLSRVQRDERREEKFKLGDNQTRRIASTEES